MSESSEDISSRGGRRRSCLSNGTTAKEQQQQQQEIRKVAFNEIEIREFPVGLGDNPAVLSGPPIALEWEPQKTHVLSVDAYEGAMGEGIVRRRGKELKMPSSVREGLLLEGSYSKEEIKQATKAAKLVRRQRHTTITTVDIEHIEEFVESVGRKIQRWRRRRSGVARDPAEEWVQNYYSKKSSSSGKAGGAVVLHLDSTVSLTVATSEDGDSADINEITC